MRGFMRAIGLGGLFRKSQTSAARSVARSGSGGNFRVISLEEFQSATLTFARKASDASIGRRSSSILERPQFLFFCGSDSRDSGRGWKNNSPESTELAQRLTSLNFPMPAAPTISHKMPVFFTPAQPTQATSPLAAYARQSIFATH